MVQHRGLEPFKSLNAALLGALVAFSGPFEASVRPDIGLF